MAQSIKLKNENYIDSTGVVHNKQLLSELLGKLDKSLICAKITGSNQTYNGSQNNIIKFNTVENKVGSNITMSSDGQFKINKNMNIKVSSYLNMAAYVNNQVPIVRIFKNEVEITQLGLTCRTTWGNDSLTISDYVISVQKNDIVTIRINGNTASVNLRTGSYCTLEEC